MAEVQAGTKPCIYCGQSIKESALKCRHCGSWLDGRPQERGGAGRGPGSRAAGGGRAVWDGKKLTFPKTFPFPRDRCLMCGTDARPILRWKKNWIWASPLVWLAIFLPGSVLTAAVIYLVIRKMAELELFECVPCRSRRRIATIGGTLAIVGGLFGLPILFSVVGDQIDPRNGGGIGALAGIGAWIVTAIVVHLAWISRSTPSCKKIDDTSVTLQFPDPELTRRALSAEPSGAEV